jgi:hypothetical protein
MITNLLYGFSTLVFTTFLLNSSITIAANTSTLFDSHETLELELSVDFDSLCRPREVEGCDYAPSTLVYKTAQGQKHSIPVELRIRGGWRARKEHCTVPPLFVRFSADETQGTPFAGQSMLPLTTHCRSKRKLGFDAGKKVDYEEYLFKEYLGYRLFNLLSEQSLRVRMVRIEYNSPAKNAKTITRHAFFTEHFDSMAARNQAVTLPDNSFDYQKIDLKAFDTVALFQFMIGNTDWSVVRERNIILIGTADGQQIPVPFDLDMAGLVNAEYAGVSPRLPFRDVRQRLYLGFCHPEADFAALLTQFQLHKDEILALPAEINGMNRKNKKTTAKYLKKFFAILGSGKKYEKDIVNVCQPWPPSPDDHTTPP